MKGKLIPDYGFGGRAFPSKWVDPEDGFEDVQYGMTLLDWFAGQALAGLVMNWHDTAMTTVTSATAAYDIADAMLAEKQRREKQIMEGGAS